MPHLAPSRADFWRLPLFAACFAALLASCSRPEVPLERRAGAPGEFCITAGDCASGNACDARRCCKVAGCSASCDALLTKEGTALAAHQAEHPDARSQLRGGCVSLCCAGTPLDEVQRALDAAVTNDPRAARAHGQLAP